MRFHRTSILGGALVIAPFLAQPATGAEQTTFPTQKAAIQALADASAKRDLERLRAILGPEGDAIVSSGDEVQDTNDLKRFAESARTRTTFVTLDDGSAIAQVGKNDWPLPIPLVKAGNRWRFDTAAGKEELLNRRIGENELVAIDVCRTYVDAQHEYAEVDRTGAGARTYAQRILSTPGKKDGLYWDDESGKDPSPLGPALAEAAAEHYEFNPGEPAPYHGYYFRILTAQGSKAPGGARSYVTDGKMRGGFGLVAYPAEYGSSGIMTFVVNQKGIVFQKNLGEKTAELGKAMTLYDPDGSWEPVVEPSED